MNKIKNKINILLVCLLSFVIISANVKANALEFSEIKNINGSSKDSSIITEYGIEDTYIDINDISLETAIENNCESSYNNETEIIADVNQVTGSITQVNSDDNNVQNDNSNVYYVGETADSNMLVDGGNSVLSSSTASSDANYYVENWQELSGDLSIKVNKQASCVTVYKGDVPIRAMVCSAGESTPEGTFYMQSQWDWLMLIKGQYGRYCSQISGDYLFHSVPYNSMDIYDLDTEMYNQLGTLCSHGCIRLTVEDAKWIYDNCSTGVEITIYNDSNPGPLGKPDFEQIPSDQTWDPTDTDIVE